MGTTTIARRPWQSKAASTEIAELARQALTASDCLYFLREVKPLPQVFRDCWLRNLAEQVIKLSQDVPVGTRYRWWHILSFLRWQGFYLTDPDLFVLQARLSKAGYLTCED